MTRSLFRPEALDYQKQYREFGQVGRLQPLTLKILAWFLIAAVGALLVFIFLAGYTRKETVSGYLAPAHGTAEVFVPQQGTVTSVHVAEDQLVAQGDLLLTIDTSQVTGDGLDVNAAVLKSLQLQKIVLTSQISAEERATRAEKDRLTAAISSGEAELAQITHQTGFQAEQIDIAQKMVDTAVKMHAQGYLSAPEFYKRQQELLDAKQGLSSLKQRYAARETELSQTRNSLEQLPTEFDAKAATLAQRIGADRATSRRGRRTAILFDSRSNRGARDQYSGDRRPDRRP